MKTKVDFKKCNNLIEELLSYNKKDGRVFSNIAWLFKLLNSINFEKNYLINKEIVDSVLDFNGENQWFKTWLIFDKDAVTEEFNEAPVSLIEETSSNVLQFFCSIATMRFKHTNPFIKKTETDILKELNALSPLLGDNKDSIKDARFLIESNNNENSYYDCLVGEITGLNI